MLAQKSPGPIQPPDSGFGAWGKFEIDSVTFNSALFKNRKVSVFFPKNDTTSNPTIFFSHGYGGTYPAFYSKLIFFLASKGYTVVFSPYSSVGSDIEKKYNTLWQGFADAVKYYPNLIDTTKVGFAGHSFGGGACFAMAYRGIHDRHWGSNGSFIYSMAPWYLYDISQEQLQNFPVNTKIIVEVFENDNICDHRIGIDAFEQIAIANEEKDFITVNAGKVNGYGYGSDHLTPVCMNSYDALDCYAIFRLMDALAVYTFQGDSTAKKIALGNGSAEQITMPSYENELLTPLTESDDPVASHRSDFYFWHFNNPANPRK